ncbi:hypothetical protein GE21DRAFT_1268547 [Neurospora crassa]|nr:hypothetical protein B9J10.200 [imported] - Neurospora crassa [Neurospora crassa]KHE78310.1 hypothetical protein GE21DRAFT_1268547 [Neurospora crassa]
MLTLPKIQVLCRIQTLNRQSKKHKTRLPRTKAVAAHLDTSIASPSTSLFEIMVVVYSPEILGKGPYGKEYIPPPPEDLFRGSNKACKLSIQGYLRRRASVRSRWMAAQYVVVVAELARRPETLSDLRRRSRGVCYNSGAFASASFVAMSISDDTEQTRLQIDFHKKRPGTEHHAMMPFVPSMMSYHKWKSNMRLPDVAFLFILGCLGNGSVPCSPGSIWNATVRRREEGLRAITCILSKRVPTLGRHNRGCDWLLAGPWTSFPFCRSPNCPPQNGPPNSARIPEHGMGERERCPIKNHPPPLYWI